jgi:phage internal scaffolding protein
MYGKLRVDSVFPAKGRTKQSFKAQCDINSIVAKYNATGAFSHLTSKRGMYADVSAVPDYRSALDIVAKADAAFNGLSSKVRERFNNDPDRMVAFLRDPSNVDEGVKLGLLVRKEAPPAPPAPPLPVPAPAPKP